MKMAVLVLLSFYLVSCEENDPDRYKTLPISGTVTDLTTGKNIPGFSVQLYNVISNGILTPATYVFIDSKQTNENGFFSFSPYDGRFMELRFSCEDTFKIDSCSYLKYWGQTVSINDDARKNLKITFNPQAVLYLRFVTDTPLQENETLGFNGYDGGSTYSSWQQPPDLRICDWWGNKTGTYYWSIKRNGKPEESFQDTVFIRAFSKREKVVRY